MQTCERRLIVLNFLQNQPVRQETVTIGSIRFIVQEHGIGWDFKAAEMIIQNYDGYADGFVLSGIPKHLGFQEPKLHHPAYLRLIRVATKTPLYVADDVRNLFSEWGMKKLLQEQPQLFFGKKVLFQCGALSPVLPQIHQAGAKVLAADLLFISGIPLLLRGPGQIQALLKGIRPVLDPVFFDWVKPTSELASRRFYRSLQLWMSKCDIIVGFGSFFSTLDSFESLAGKVVLVDYVDSNTRARLESAGVAQIIEFTPDQVDLKTLPFCQFPMLTAIIDQTRLFEKSPLDFQDYLLKWLERTHLSPRPLKSSKGIRRKCAFIFHPLSQADIWKNPSLRFLKETPRTVRNWVEKGISYGPCFQIGKLTGVASEATGQEVDCDFYVLPATPRQILGMNEEFLYRRLVQCAQLAKSRGAGLIGLGAYTKVAGDAGVTVARRSPIPVTNGNSYSASTTLWAARQVVESMNLVSPEKVGNRFKAKAMIIGATGSIGRVSTLLMSLVFQELVLVANRADKLLELREEVLRLSPEVKVSITTQSSLEISDADLVVTATSNQSGSVLDIQLVKPGAVICDCSRPVDVTRAEAEKRPDVLVIESGEVILPGNPRMNVDLGLPQPSVYACTAETVLLALEGRFESFSLSKQLSLEKTKEIYKLGVKHGARLSAIQGPLGLITDEKIAQSRALALERLKTWNLGHLHNFRSPETLRKRKSKIQVASKSTFQSIEVSAHES